MINIEPITYRSRFDWYVVDDHKHEIDVYSTKSEALMAARKQDTNGPNHCIQIGWTPRDGRPLGDSISKVQPINDLRKRPSTFTLLHP